MPASCQDEFGQIGRWNWHRPWVTTGDDPPRRTHTMRLLTRHCSVGAFPFTDRLRVPCPRLCVGMRLASATRSTVSSEPNTPTLSRGHGPFSPRLSRTALTACLVLLLFAAADPAAAQSKE